MTTYYVRADGTVLAADKANATSAAAAATSLDMTQFNACTFSAGDFIYFSAKGGDYTVQLTVPSGGSAGNIITYEGLLDGTASAIPVIDVSGDVSDAMGIYISSKSYVAVNRFQIKGSGGGQAFYADGTSGEEGFTVTATGIDVLSNYGSSDATDQHDGFSLENSAQVILYDVTATGCRESAAPFTGAHQAFTTHTTAKLKVYGATISDCNEWIEPTDSGTVEVHNMAADTPLHYGFVLPAAATASASIAVYDSTLTGIAGSTAFIYEADGVDAAASISIYDSTITISGAGSTGAATYRSAILFSGCTWTVNSTTFNQVVSAGSVLTLTGNTMTITDVANQFTRTAADGGVINIEKNTIIGPASNDIFIRWYNTTAAAGGGYFRHNVVQSFVGTGYFLSIDAGCQIPPTIYNNTFVEASSTGKAINNGGPAVGQNLDVKNNIFVNVADVINGSTRLTVAYNDYYNSENYGGTGSITTDPSFLSATDFHLAWGSPCINTGTDLGLTSDRDGQTVPSMSLPDMGAYEFQPDDPFSLNREMAR